MGPQKHDRGCMSCCYLLFVPSPLPPPPSLWTSPQILLTWQLSTDIWTPTTCSVFHLHLEDNQPQSIYLCVFCMCVPLLLPSLLPFSFAYPAITRCPTHPFIILDYEQENEHLPLRFKTSPHRKLLRFQIKSCFMCFWEIYMYIYVKHNVLWLTVAGESINKTIKHRAF